MTLTEVSQANPHAILIHSGILFDVFNPREEDIHEEDMAHALSHLCRYGGHSPKFYSVAQHSVLCSYYPGTPEEQMEYLVHDGSEAYVVDVPRPIKKRLLDYILLEENIQRVIFNRFKLRFPMADSVHQVDDAMLYFEYNAFFTNPDPNFEFWTPEVAKAKFLERFYELKSQIEAI